MAGRTKGAPNKRTMTHKALVAEAVIAAQAAGIGFDSLQPSNARIARMTMLEIMIYAAVQAACAGQWGVAAEFASKAAPYRHAKLSYVESNIHLNTDPNSMTDAQLVAIIASGSSTIDADAPEGEDESC